MMLIDQNAYNSRLRKIDPIIKIITSLMVLLIGLLANSYLVSAIIIVTTGFVIVKYGGTNIVLLLKLMLLPISFLIMGVLTIIIQRADSSNSFLVFTKIFSFYYGFNISTLDIVGRLVFKSVASILCMYFIALTTPMTEFFCALRRLKLPKLFIELMELIYRFIFVLTSTANQIYIAQSSRLGYNGVYASYKSLGILVSMLFVKSYKCSDRIYIALESRGYDGELNMIGFEYERELKHYLYSGIFISVLIIIAIYEGLVIR